MFCRINYFTDYPTFYFLTTLYCHVRRSEPIAGSGSGIKFVTLKTWVLPSVPTHQFYKYTENLHTVRTIELRYDHMDYIRSWVWTTILSTFQENLYISMQCFESWSIIRMDPQWFGSPCSGSDPDPSAMKLAKIITSLQWFRSLTFQLIVTINNTLKSSV